jgi:hypothetical protein
MATPERKKVRAEPRRTLIDGFDVPGFELFADPDAPDSLIWRQPLHMEHPPPPPTLTGSIGRQTLLGNQTMIVREGIMRAFLAVAALALSLSPALAQQAQHTMVNANEVQWKEAPPILPGAQVSVLYGDPAKDGMFVMRLKFPAN